MQEFESISASSYDPSALAAKLTTKAAEGWSVVAIVPTGGDVTAFLTRGAGVSAPAADAVTSAATEPAAVAEVVDETAATATETVATVDATVEAVSEPSGWAIAPEPATPTAEPSLPESGISLGQAASYQPTTTYEPTTTYQPAPAPEPAPVAAPEPAPAPAVPAGWYADPAGRFELRYWDGSSWTEHVSRAGQQFTDPPVA